VVTFKLETFWRLYREHKPQDDAMTIWIFIGPLPNLMNFREYLGIINF